MSKLGFYKYYQGMTVTQDSKNQILQLSQRAYLEKILLDHQMTDCKLATISIKTQHFTAAAIDYQPDKQFRTRYQFAAGLLIYAILDIRPDLTFIISVVSH